MHAKLFRSDAYMQRLSKTLFRSSAKADTVYWLSKLPLPASSHISIRSKPHLIAHVPHPGSPGCLLHMYHRLQPGTRSISPHVHAWGFSQVKSSLLLTPSPPRGARCLSSTWDSFVHSVVKFITLSSQRSLHSKLAYGHCPHSHTVTDCLGGSAAKGPLLQDIRWERWRAHD
jgi:hypothetical protein